MHSHVEGVSLGQLLGLVKDFIHGTDKASEAAAPVLADIFEEAGDARCAALLQAGAGGYRTVDEVLPCVFGNGQLLTVPMLESFVLSGRPAAIPADPAAEEVFGLWVVFGTESDLMDSFGHPLTVRTYFFPTWRERNAFLAALIEANMHSGCETVCWYFFERTAAERFVVQMLALREDEDEEFHEEDEVVSEDEGGGFDFDEDEAFDENEV